MLEVVGLHAGYGDTAVLRGLDLTIGAGEVVAVLGANGVGKTTLARVLSGVVPAQGGRVRFAGEDITRAGAAAIVAAGLIHVPGGAEDFSRFERAGEPGARQLSAWAGAGGGPNLERMFGIFPRLRERMGQRAGTLSGGEQQMLAIGRGLMAEPRLLILDEPSLGLSPLMVGTLFALIADLNREGLPIMLVEQNVMQSLDLAGRGYVLEHGVCALSGPADALREDAGLRRAYLGL